MARGHRPARAIATALLVAGSLLAGCSAPQPGAVFRVEGRAPVVFLGYDYAGATAAPGEGTATIEVDASGDTGSAVATFHVGNAAWRAEFVAFQQSRPFQEGGVRNLFQEHGATGNGDALLPELHALSAGWGPGRVSVDGQPFQDPATGSATFNLHYMVTDTAPRDPATRMVTKADGRSPYDPAAPGDAKVLAGTRQLLLNVQSSGGPFPADATTTAAGSGAGVAAQTNTSHAFSVNLSTARVQVDIGVAGSAGPAPGLGTLSFQVVDPNGTEAARWDYSPLPGQGSAPTASLEVPPPLLAGEWQVRVTGQGAAVNYRVDATVDYPESIFFHVVYTDVTVG